MEGLWGRKKKDTRAIDKDRKQSLWKIAPPSARSFT